MYLPMWQIVVLVLLALPGAVTLASACLALLMIAVVAPIETSLRRSREERDFMAQLASRESDRVTAPPR